MHIYISRKFAVKYCVVVLIFLVYIFGLQSFRTLYSNHASSTSTSNRNESTPIYTTVHNFKKDTNLLNQLITVNMTKLNIDLLLNIRKLTLFAVHELNEQGNEQFCASKCWTNPLKIVYLKTYHFEHFQIHDLIFNVEPGNIPIFVKVKQQSVTFENILETNELEIQGSFVRLYQQSVSLNKQGIYDKEIELDTWRPHVSFTVSDYLRFNDKRAFIISPDKAANFYCGSALKILVMVSSEPANFFNRRIIRRTYGSPETLVNKQVRVVFLFGRFGNKTLQALIEKEANEHEDIIQSDFLDSYHNLTLSHLSMYNWIQTTCGERPLPKHILKADDDFFINVDLALMIADVNPDAHLIGIPYCWKEPVRDTRYMAKYYLPRYMYSPNMFVGYISGIAYLVMADVIQKLLKMALTTPIIHMDDVYITGLLTRQLGIVPRTSRLFTTLKCQLNHCETKKMVNCYAEKNMGDIITYWKDWASPMPKNCTLENLNVLVEPETRQNRQQCFLE